MIVMVSSNIFGKVFVIFCVVRVTRCLNKLNVTRCPDPDVNTVEWKQYDKACQDKNPTYKFHCQQDNTGSVTTLHSYCAVPEQCLAGYYPFINGNTAECQRCSKGTYQTKGKISYEYKYPSCDEPNPGEIECRSGSTTENRRFKCNWMDGYIPDSNSTVCLCFSHDDLCSCNKIPCEDGKERNENYTCVPSMNTSTSTSMKPPTTTSTKPPTTTSMKPPTTTSTKPPTTTSMKPPTTTSTKPPTTSNKTPDWVLPVAIVVTIAIAIVIAVVVVVIVLCSRIVKLMMRKKGWQDINEDGNREPLMSNEQERTQNKDRRKTERNSRRDFGNITWQDDGSEQTEMMPKDRCNKQKNVQGEHAGDQTVPKSLCYFCCPSAPPGYTFIVQNNNEATNETGRRETNLTNYGDLGNAVLGDNSGPQTTDRRKSEINAHTVGNMATGDSHSGNQTATMPAGSEDESSTDTSL